MKKYNFPKNTSKKIISQSNEKGFLINILSIILMLYIASLIVFKIEYYHISYIFNIMLLGIFTLLFLMKKLKIYKANKVIFIYFIFSVFSLATSMWAVDFDRATLKSLQLFLIVINMILISNVIRNYHIMHFFMYGILLGSFFNFIFAFEIVPTTMEIYAESRFQGTVGNANDLAIVMIISIFISIIYLSYEKEKCNNKILFYYQYINIILSLYLILLSVSKKGIIFGFSLVFIYVLTNMIEFKNIIRLVVAGLIGYIAFINFSNLDDFWETFSAIERRFTLFQEGISSGSSFGSTGLRLYFIRLGLEIFQEHPIFGIGLNNFRLYSGGYYAHNNYIELLVGTGVVGFTIFYAIYIYLFRKILQTINFDLKYMFIVFLIILLGMDIASVTYYNKLFMYLLLFIFIILERNINYQSEKL